VIATAFDGAQCQCHPGAGEREIIERGDHADLLEQKGRYYQLYTGSMS